MPGSSRRTRSRSASERLAAERIFINVGGRASVPPIPGIDRVPYLTNTTVARRWTSSRSTWSSSAAAMSGWSSRRSSAASAREVTVLESGAAAGAARGRGDLRRDPCLPGERRRAHRLRRRRDVAVAPAQRGVEVSVTHDGDAHVDRRLAPAAGGRPAAEHRRSRPGSRRGRGRCARLHHGGRAVAHQRAGHLGARRLQRPRRVHPYRLQRLRNRRRQSAGRRDEDGERPHRRLCAVHRSAARPRRDDRGRGARVRPHACWSRAWPWRMWRAPSRRARPRD